MTYTPSHYESLKVTRDAPLEVIRAAYRSLSQKHHPDKNSGDQEAARVMARLNAAYSVLSDTEQRARYDMEIDQRAREQQYAFADGDDDDFSGAYGASAAGEPGRPSASQAEAREQQARHATASILQRIRRHPTGKEAQIAALTIGGAIVVVAMIAWTIRKDQESMLLLERAALSLPRPAAAPEAQAPTAPSKPPEAPAAAKPAAAKPAPAEARAAAAKPAATPKAQEGQNPALKPSEYERLTAMLKSMGLGLHKLDLPKQAPAAKPAAAPAKAEKAEKVEKPAALAKAAPAAPSRTQAAKPAAAADAAPAREENERAVAQEAARADARPAAAPAAPAPASSAATANAARQAPVIDMRSCAAPTYPATAHRNGESGTVQLALLVGGDGRVIESKIQKSSGYAELDKAARKALSKCSFKVTGGDRQAEPVWTRLDYVFSLD